MSKLWGGRFSEENIDNDVLKFTSSLEVDSILAEQDCDSSKAHVEMLAKCGFLTGEEKSALIKALEELSEKISAGSMRFEGYEDIHSAIQGFVEKRVPEASEKLHSGRSRNEQVVNDMRLYCRKSVMEVQVLIERLQKAFILLADRYDDTVIPGYTHLNRAQPVLFAHLILAYVEMLERDHGRLRDALARSDVSVMGSGAIAGSALELDRDLVAGKLGFKTISSNSIDAVSDRDFIAEITGALSILAVHLSRIAEDLILYSIPEFGLIDMGSAFCTGSSLMPQKRNPDVLELVRGKTSQLVMAFGTILTVLKGLPHSYNRDLQEDKKPLFESMKTIVQELSLMARLIDSLEVDKERASLLLESEFIYATDIAEYLVKKGLSFKEAHGAVGKMVLHCDQKGINISGLSISELKDFSGKLDEDVFGLLDPDVSVGNKKTKGSTNPDMVKKNLSVWKKKFKV